VEEFLDCQQALAEPLSRSRFQRALPAARENCEHGEGECREDLLQLF